MTAWLLDTNAFIALMTRRSEALLRRIAATAPESLAVSAIVAHELYFGAYRSERIESNLETLRLFLADFAMLELDREDARAAG